MYRKIVIAVDCEDEAQKDEVQRIAQEVSTLRLFNGGQLIAAYPFFRGHQAELMRLFEMVSKGGVKSLMSASGINIISQLTKKR